MLTRKLVGTLNCEIYKQAARRSIQQWDTIWRAFDDDVAVLLDEFCGSRSGSLVDAVQGENDVVFEKNEIKCSRWVMQLDEMKATVWSLISKISS